MLKSHCRSLKSTLLCASIFSHYNSHEVHDEIHTEEQEDNSSEGWKRLKAMYSYDKRGSLSPQLSLVSSGAFTSFAVGFIIGGYLDSRNTYIKFIEENRTTKYLGQMDAKRQLQDKITLRMFSGGFKVGWRLSFLTAAFLATAVSITTYMGKTTIWDFIAGGSVSCAAYKFKHGPKPTISAAVVGGSFGAVAGATMLGILKIAGFTFDDIFRSDAESIERKQDEVEALLDQYRKTYERLNIGKVYRRGSTMGSDDTIGSSNSTAIAYSDDSSTKKRHPHSTVEEGRSE